MDDTKIYYIDRFGIPDIEKNDVLKNIEIKQLLIQIIMAQTLEDSMTSYVHLYHMCGKRKLQKILKLPIRNGKECILLQALPIFKKVQETFDEKNLFQLPVILGILDTVAPFRERVVFGTETSYVFGEKKEQNVYFEFQKKKEVYTQLNEAILRQDICYLQENISLIQTLPSYKWVITYFELHVEPAVIELSRTENLYKKTSIS